MQAETQYDVEIKLFKMQKGSIKEVKVTKVTKEQM